MIVCMVCIYACMNVNIYLTVCICMCMCIYVHVCMCLFCVFICMYVFICVYLLLLSRVGVLCVRWAGELAHVDVGPDGIFRR